MEEKMERDELEGPEMDRGQRGAPRGSGSRRYLSYEEVAAELGVSRTTIERMVRDGRLRGIRVGERKMRISRDDLDRFLEGPGKEGDGQAGSRETRRQGETLPFAGWGKSAPERRRHE
jgi:excisionase family DNA binding protein